VQSVPRNATARARSRKLFARITAPVERPTPAPKPHKPIATAPTGSARDAPRSATPANSAPYATNSTRRIVNTSNAKRHTIRPSRLPPVRYEKSVAVSGTGARKYAAAASRITPLCVKKPPMTIYVAMAIAAGAAFSNLILRRACAAAPLFRGRSETPFPARCAAPARYRPPRVRRPVRRSRSRAANRSRSRSDCRC
jgi:hypothetical protein